MKSLCVYCGSSAGNDPRYAARARAFGALLASRGITVVFGGSHSGIMGAVADGALEGGGRVIGVIPRSLIVRERAHTALTEQVVVDSMHERKAAMAERSEGFVALPGGLGTLEELFEVLTWAQLGIHDKPCGVLDIGGYFAGLLAFLDGAVEAGFVSAAHRALLVVDDDPEALLARFESYEPPPVIPWLDPTET
jgi:uncharacterized protein (TIGR00730 family)